MQNSAVITKVEYRLFKNVVSEFLNLNMIPYSGSFSETVSINKAGHLYTATSKFNIAKSESHIDEILKSIKSTPAQFKLYDANGFSHTIGSEEFPARLTYQKVLAGSPGSFNGYRCTVLCYSPYGSTVS